MRKKTCGVWYSAELGFSGYQTTGNNFKSQLSPRIWNRNRKCFFKVWIRGLCGINSWGEFQRLKISWYCWNCSCLCQIVSVSVSVRVLVHVQIYVHVLKVVLWKKHEKIKTWPWTLTWDEQEHEVNITEHRHGHGDGHRYSPCLYPCPCPCVSMSTFACPCSRPRLCSGVNFVILISTDFFDIW
jgi:hypothetical protein